MSGVPVGLLATLTVAAVLVAAVLSAGEAAVLRIARNAVADLLAARHPAAERVRRLAEDRVAVAGSASVVRLLCEMLAAVCLTLAIAASDLAWSVELVIAVLACAFLTVVLARLSPRSLGHRYPGRVLAAISRPLVGVRVLAGPLVRVAGTEIDEDPLRDVVERVGDGDGSDQDERAMVRSVLGLGDTLTREVMVPRTDMVTTAEDTPLRKVLSLLLRSGYSRVPVVGEQVDDLKGVLYLKDLVRRVQDDGEEAADAPAVSLVRPAVFVPESKPVDELLRELQAGASHIAMVVDEYGGIAGLVTIEDALEEIVGELTDEHDPSAPQVEDLGGGTYLVPARLAKDELGELFGLEVDDDDVDTAGGLLAKALGKVPIPGSAGEIHGLRLVAQGTEGRRKRVARVLVSRVPEADPDGRDPRETPETTGSRVPRDARDGGGTPARGVPAGRPPTTPTRSPHQ